MGGWFVRSEKEWIELAERLKLKPCPYCKAVGTLIRHGYLRGYEDGCPTRTKRAQRIFCSNRYLRPGCGQTFSVWLADKIRRLSVTTRCLWGFLKRAVEGTVAAAIRATECERSERTCQRLWKRFDLGQSDIRTALLKCCSPPKLPAGSTRNADATPLAIAAQTLAHLQTAFPDTDCPIANQHLVATVARTLHTYTNTVKILCDAFKVEFESSAFKCERRLIEQAFSLNHAGKSLTTILDDAHLMDLANLRKLRLLFEDFPKNHNLILVGRPNLLAALDLGVNLDIKSRVTYSVITKRLNADDMRGFILRELDRVGLGHNTFTSAAVDLIVRSADGVLRKARNLCVGCMIEAVRTANKQIDIDNVNRVLLQPHWQKETDLVDY